MQVPQFIAIGFIAGILSGMFGIGGGLIIVPCLVTFMAFETTRAIGTSLMAILLPVGILGVLRHHRANNVDIRAALLLDIGVFFGALIGASIIVNLPKVVVNRLFAGFLILVAIQMLFKK